MRIKVDDSVDPSVIPEISLAGLKMKDFYVVAAE